MSPQQFACIILNLILLTFVSYNAVYAAVELKLTNIECESLDQSLIKIRECRLKIIRRGVPALNAYAEISRPINDIKFNVALYKKASGYKPFLYNISADFCKFMEKSSTNTLSGILFNFGAEYSNINHTCPYSGAVIVKNLILTEDKFRLIPLPSGEYMIKGIASAGGQPTAFTKFYFTRIE